MEVVDAGVLGVRSALLELRSREVWLRFTIHPMVHLGEPAFYREISRRLEKHDLVVAEGIQGSDRTVRRLDRIYRWSGGNRRLGLMQQPDVTAGS